MNMTQGPVAFEHWLCAGLSRALYPLVNRPSLPPPRFAAAVASRRLMRGLVLAGSTVAALSAMTAMAATGSANPQDWGQRVSAAVASCKQQLKPGQHGIGACVSAFAQGDPGAAPAHKRHGSVDARESPGVSSDRPSPKSSGGEGPASANGIGHAYGRTDQPTPPGQVDRGTPPGQAKDTATPPGQGKAAPPGQLKVNPTPPGQLNK